MTKETDVPIDQSDLIDLTADIVAAFVSNNTIPGAELPALITNVHEAMQNVFAATNEPHTEPLVPAVSIRRSIGTDHMVCLDCGQKFKALKRHLRTHHGLTPANYREKWSLASDYPMVTPNYAKARSDLAKKMGLGKGNQTKGKS